VVLTLNTASAVISFATRSEEDTATFYERLAALYPKGKEAFLSFSKENRKNKVTVERAYYGVISDALEAGFAFREGLNPATYTVEAGLAEGASYADALKVAIDKERRIQQLYSESAKLSEGLMADVTRVFKVMARKREDRLAKLNALVRAE
jgi:rubrerythrin